MSRSSAHSDVARGATGALQGEELVAQLRCKPLRANVGWKDGRLEPTRLSLLFEVSSCNGSAI